MKHSLTIYQPFKYWLQSTYPIKIKSTLMPLIFLSMSTLCYAAEIEKKPIEAENQQQPKNNLIEISPTISWSTNLQKLSKDNSADETLWLDVKEQKLLVLKYWAKGSKKRGNIILMHAEGENAEHPRLIKPLTFQLSQLGWQIFVPTLPIEDYPFQIKEELTSLAVNNQAKTTNQEPAINNEVASSDKSLSQPKTFFPNTEEYQNFINQVLQELVLKTQPSTEPLILIAAQNNAYWILQKTKQIAELTQVVLLEPKLPKMIQLELETSFNGQSLPVYSFFKNDGLSKPFTQAFEKNYWPSIYHRFNTELMNASTLEIEDIRLAKKITGWSEAIKKTSL